jgi:hypothetical protein
MYEVTAGRAGGDASQHRLCLAFRARWSRDMGHHAHLRSGGSATLSVTGNGPKAGGDGTNMRFGFPEPLLNIAHFTIFNGRICDPAA